MYFIFHCFSSPLLIVNQFPPICLKLTFIIMCCFPWSLCTLSQFSGVRQGQADVWLALCVQLICFCYLTLQTRVSPTPRSQNIVQPYSECLAVLSCPALSLSHSTAHSLSAQHLFVAARRLWGYLQSDLLDSTARREPRFHFTRGSSRYRAPAIIKPHSWVGDGWGFHLKELHSNVGNLVRH